MKFELNQILDVIEEDIEYWCNEKMGPNKCNSKCKYFTCNICNGANDSIEKVRQLAAACFGANYESGKDEE